MSRLTRYLAAGIGTAIAGFAAYYVIENRTPRPAYRVLKKDGAFELRDYPAMLVATTEEGGERNRALQSGFRKLADYIFAKHRDGDKIAMTAPVLQTGGKPAGHWQTHFVIPAEYTRETLPDTPVGVRIEDMPARRLAAITFSGNPDTSDLYDREAQLRHWLEEEGLQPIGGFEYAFYNSPMIPPPLRRNEVLVPVHAD